MPGLSSSVNIRKPASLDEKTQSTWSVSWEPSFLGSRSTGRQVWCRGSRLAML